MFTENLGAKLATVLVFTALTVPAAWPADAGNSALGDVQAATAEKAGKPAGAKHLKKRQTDESVAATGTNVQMRLTGSLCVGCLVELERKLKLMPGISRAKIDIPGAGGFYDGYSGPGATGIITASMSYDPKTISLEQVEDFIRTQGYTLRRVIER